MIEAQLTNAEMMMGVRIGEARQEKAILRKYKDKHGFERAGWTEHIEGCFGEILISKHLGVYWGGNLDSFKDADILRRVQVKTRSKHKYDLVFRPDDNEDHVFVLVTGKCPNYRLHGFMRGFDCKREDWWKNPGDRPYAWFVPKEALQPIEDLYPRIDDL